MNLNSIDKLVPGRWTLWFRYYFPFFKKPEHFYFELRKLINRVKGSSPEEQRGKLPELVTILNDPQVDTELAKKIITTLLTPEEAKNINESLLRKILNCFELSSDSTLLDEILSKLPTLPTLPNKFSIYANWIIDKFKQTVTNNRVENRKKHFRRHTNRIVESKDQISASLKLKLAVSIIDDNLKSEDEDTKNIYALLGAGQMVTTIQEGLLPVNFTANFKEKLLGFIIEWQANLKVSHQDFLILLSCLSTEEKKVSFVKKYMRDFSNEASITFLSELSLSELSNEESKKLLETILTWLVEEKGSSLVDTLIIHFFDSLSRYQKKMKPLILHIQKNCQRYSLSLFQALLIHNLSSKQIKIETLVKFKHSNTSILENTFKTQLDVIDRAISITKALISEWINSNVPRTDTNTKNSTPALWHRFNDEFNNDDSSSITPEEIINSIPNTQGKKEESRHLFLLLKQLYEIRNRPEIKKEIRTDKLRIISEERRDGEERKERLDGDGAATLLSFYKRGTQGR
ncbi:MAG: hypothetical protein V4700_00230 [Pseudomonadota bacterium]